jgi:hypothetical protein
MTRSMKFSLAASLLILVIGGATGLMQRGQGTQLRKEHAGLVAKARELGISTDVQTGDERLTKRQRDESVKRAGLLGGELAAFAKEMEQHEKNGGEHDEAFEKRAREMMTRLMELDAAGLKQVIAGLRDDAGLSDEMRRNLIGFSIMMLGESHPASAMAIYSESSDLLAGGPMGEHVAIATLESWAKTDPMAAIAWMRKNAGTDLADETAKTAIISGLAANDPHEAFRMLAEIKPEDESSAIQILMESGKTPEQRTALLDALRGHLLTLPDGMDREELLAESLESLARNLTGERYDAVKSWLDASKLTPEQTSQFAAGLSYFNTKDDTGRWIDWMAENLPKDDIAENVDNLIGQWTQQDYLAAGRWLTAAPEGPAKDAAISTYAQTVAEYEPQTAVQWAMTLPAGQERQDTLEAIYQNWPKRDAAAAAAFAKEHGIDTTAEEE